MYIQNIQRKISGTVYSMRTLARASVCNCMCVRVCACVCMCVFIYCSTIVAISIFR